MTHPTIDSAPPADRAAVQAFEDQGIVRRFLLSRERAREDAVLGREGERKWTAKAASLTAAAARPETIKGKAKTTAAPGSQRSLGWQ